VNVKRADAADLIINIDNAITISVCTWSVVNPSSLDYLTKLPALYILMIYKDGISSLTFLKSAITRYAVNTLHNDTFLFMSIHKKYIVS